MNLSPNRGRGERRVPAAPAASCAVCSEAHECFTTDTPGSPGVPARNGFNGLCRALPGDRALLPPSSADIVLSKPGWADATPQNLTPASGRQDHTTSPYAATSLVRVLLTAHRPKPALRSRRAQNAAASTASHPAFATIAIRPSCGVGWRGFVEMICPTGEAKYFCKGDSTQKCPTGKSPHGGESKFPSCPGRGAAPFALLRRAGTYVDTRTLDP